MSRNNDYVVEAQDATRRLWSAVNDLVRLQREWIYRDYSNTLGPGITLTEHPTVEDLGAVVLTTADALNALMLAGHGTNITKVL